MTAAKAPPHPGFIIYLDGLAFDDAGNPLKCFVQLDRYGDPGPGESVGFPVDPIFASAFNLRAAYAWLESYPLLALRAHVVHPLTGVEAPL